MIGILPHEHRIGACVSLHKLAPQTQATIHLRDELANLLAAELVKHVKREEHEFSIDYRVDLYVLSGDQLAALIQQEARSYDMLRSLS